MKVSAVSQVSRDAIGRKECDLMCLDWKAVKRLRGQINKLTESYNKKHTSSLGKYKSLYTKKN